MTGRLYCGAVVIRGQYSRNGYSRIIRARVPRRKLALTAKARGTQLTSYDDVGLRGEIVVGSLVLTADGYEGQKYDHGPDHRDGVNDPVGLAKQ